VTRRRARDETERVRRIWDREAKRFDRCIAFFERFLFRGDREWVCSQAKGDVLEVAVGTGRNFEFYPDDVWITGVELSPRMAELASERAAVLGRAVDVRIGDAQTLEFADESFDTVVVTISLCSIPDDRRTVAEIQRVLRPGGRVLLAEHVRSPNPVVRAVQTLLNPITVRFEGDHWTREPLDHLRGEGFEIERLERHNLGIVERVVARKPA
jgi:ubiquinone/menaquinone biosynthesis C-methylase UbiE